MMQMVFNGGANGGGGAAFPFPFGAQAAAAGAGGAPPMVAGDFAFGNIQQLINQLMQQEQGCVLDASGSSSILSVLAPSKRLFSYQFDNYAVA
jgi:hypothetical protein